MIKSRLVFAVLAALVLAPGLSKAQTYVLMDLGAGLNAVDISPNGRVVGRRGLGFIAYRWTPNGAGMTALSLGTPHGAIGSSGWGVNDTGQVAAIAGGYTWLDGYNWSNGRWTNMSSKSDQSQALGINSAGTMVGGLTSSGACIWKAGVCYPLGRGIPAIGINDSGQVVGAGGFLWTPTVPNGTTGTFIVLPTGGGSGFGINGAGDVVGFILLRNSMGRIIGNHAFYWSNTAQVVTDIGTLQPDPSNPGQYLGNSTARKINTAGQVVGTSDVGGGVTHGFLWDAVNGMRDLNNSAKITIVGIPAGQTWVFTCPILGTNWANIPAISINDAGQICGTATVTVNGTSQSHAFLLLPQ